MKSFSSFSSSSATGRVDKATSHLLIGPDWTMNMDICDGINNDQWQAKEVLKAVKKRLQNKNPKVQFLALTLLETIVKNCGDYVHFQVAERNILQEMIKIVRKKTDMQVRDKILVLLDSWQEAFGGPDGKYPQYYWAYIELKRSGIVFPQRSANTPPIFTPPVSHSEVISRHLEVGYDMPSASVRLDEAVASGAGNMSLSDFNCVRDVMELLREVLQAVNPRDRGAIKDELIVELVKQCRANQKNLMQLLSSTRDEKLLGEGLELNDSLQSLLAMHEAIASGTPLPAPAEASKSLPQEKKPVEPPIRSQFEDEDEDDDDFAQLAHRNSKLKQVNSEGTSVNSSDLLSPNRSDITTVTESSTSSSAMSNALVPLDPPPPVKIRKEEQDMIDLLSITLSAYPSSPHTPMTPSISSQHGSSIPASPNGQGYSHNSQPFHPINQGDAPYNSYVAPWAQRALPPPQPQPQLSQFSVSSPSWAAANANPSSFQSTAYQFPSSHANSPRAANLPAYSSRPLQHYNSFGSRVNGTAAPAAAFTGEIPANANLRQSGTPTSPKPYVLPNRLFEDLIDLRSKGTGQKISTRSPLSAGTSNQPMIGGKK